MTTVPGLYRGNVEMSERLLWVDVETTGLDRAGVF